MVVSIESWGQIGIFMFLFWHRWILERLKRSHVDLGLSFHRGGWLVQSLLMIIIVFLKLTVEGSCRMFSDMRYQFVHFGEGLVAGVAVVMVLPLEFAEGSAAAQFRAIEGAAAGRIIVIR